MSLNLSYQYNSTGLKGNIRFKITNFAQILYQSITDLNKYGISK